MGEHVTRHRRRAGAKRAGMILAGVATAMLWAAGAQGAGPQPAPGKTPLPGSAPLLAWSLLRQTYYDPRQEMVWPDSLHLYDGKVVRLEGYVLPNFGSQDPADVLLSANHPTSLFCGPSDMTALVEVFMPGFDPEEWPQLPVEMTGTFHLTKNHRNLHAIYRLTGKSWRPLRVWEQDFPGAVEEQQDAQDDGGP